MKRKCVLSLDLFSWYSELILREIEELHGVSINDRNINNTRYADDTALIDETEKSLECILNTFIEKSKSLELSLNSEKTYSMIVSKKKFSLCKLTANGIGIKQVEK